MSLEARRWRFWLLAACAVCLVLWFVESFDCTPLMPWCSNLGFTTNSGTDRSGAPYTLRVESVARNGAAERAGLRVGDLIDLRQISLHDRLLMRTYGVAAAGDRVTYVVRRDGATRKIGFTAPAATPRWGGGLELQGSGRWWDPWIYYLSALWALLLAAYLVVRCSGVKEARLLAALLMVSAANIAADTTAPTTSFAFDFARDLLSEPLSLLVIAFFVGFCACIARPLSLVRRILMWSSIAAASLSALAWCAWLMSTVALFPSDLSVKGSLSPIWETIAFAEAAAYLLALGTGVATAIAAKGAPRQRAIWVTLSLAIPFIYDGLTPVIVTPQSWFATVLIGNVASFIAPLGLTYAVASGRILNVGFVVNRATVVAALVAFVVVVLALVQWSLASLLTGIGHLPGLVIGATVTLTLGFSMPSLYRWITVGVERVLFRQQFQARERVERLAAGLPYAQSGEAIDDALTKGVCNNLQLPSGAVFRKYGGKTFVRFAAVGWSDGEQLGVIDADRLAMEFQGDRTRTMVRILGEKLDDSSLPQADRAPAFALPLYARQQLIGVVLYSTHAAGADLDPDERSLLVKVADRASRGFDAVELASRVEESYQSRMEAEQQAKETLRRSKAALERLNEAYVRFVPSEFLSFLEKESIVDVALGDSVERHMTILFSDIRSFTTISEGMSPAQIFTYLNRYLHRAEPIISEHGGFIDKYVGDAIMALFPTGADNALDAAVDLQREVRLLNRKLSDEKLPALAIGVGLHTGDLMLGTVGSRNRMDTTVIADAVNAASRLEGATRTFGCGILLSRQTKEALTDQNRFTLRYLGRLRVKGKREQLAIYEAFDADPADIIEHKRSTLADFAHALAAFDRGDFMNAGSEFGAIVAAGLADGPAWYYATRCKEFLKGSALELADGA